MNTHENAMNEALLEQQKANTAKTLAEAAQIAIITEKIRVEIEIMQKKNP